MDARVGRGGAAPILALVLASALALAGCGHKEASQEATTEDVPAAETQVEAAPEQTGDEAGDAAGQTSDVAADPGEGRLDTLVLVNPSHELPAGWEDSLELVEVVNPKGDTVRLDRIAYDAFLELQADLASRGVTIELNSGYRSVAEQQAIWDEFMADYGEDYVREYVAVPGYSEHHTGLALDAYLVLDGVPQLTNDEIFAAQDTWDVIHASLADHGFILRYLDGREDVTGYTYEPWHFRFVGVDAAHKIQDAHITLEEYLGAV